MSSSVNLRADDVEDLEREESQRHYGYQKADRELVHPEQFHLPAVSSGREHLPTYAASVHYVRGGQQHHQLDNWTSKPGTRGHQLAGVQLSLGVISKGKAVCYRYTVVETI